MRNGSLKNAEAQRISDDFEASFLAVRLEEQIRHCDHYELAALFRQTIPSHQPMLEAGCGSGRWVAWAVRHGLDAIGADWSEALCEKARQAISGGVFHAADMRDMPLEDGSIALITVPYLRPARKVVRSIKAPLRGLRELLRGNRQAACSRARVRASARTWAIDFLVDGQEWNFFQFLFTPKEITQIILENGFLVQEAYADCMDKGLL